MKKIALLLLVLLALGVSSAALAATATIGGETFSLHDGTGSSGEGWATNGSGHLNLFTDYAGGSIAIAVDAADPSTVLFYGDPGEDGGTVTVKGSISVTGGLLLIEDFGIGNTLTVDYTGGTKYALDGGKNMGLHNGTVKIIAPEGKAYDVKPNLDPWDTGAETAKLEVVIAQDVDAAVTAAAGNTSKIDVAFMKDKAKDTSVGGKFSFRILSGDMLEADDSHEDVVAYGDGSASAGAASITRGTQPVQPGQSAESGEKDLSEILKAGKTYTLHIGASGADDSIPGYYDSQRVIFVPGGGDDGEPDGLPFGDTDIDDLDDSGATLTATQNSETGAVTLSIVNPDLTDGESVRFYFVEKPELPQGETSVRAASRSVSAVLTITKKVKAAADGKTFTATLTKDELAGLKGGATYAVEYINEDGSVMGYSTFTAGGLKFKAKDGENKDSGGNSGCDAGFAGLFALAALACFGIRRKL